MLGEGSKSPLLFDPITVIFRFPTGLGLGNALKQHSHQGYGLCLRHGLRYWYCEIPFLSKKSCASQFGCMKLFLVSNDWKLYKLSEKYRFKGSFLNRNVQKIQSRQKNGKICKKVLFFKFGAKYDYELPLLNHQPLTEI